jgi:glutamate-5-semialdehyde dehydrogenase
METNLEELCKQAHEARIKVGTLDAELKNDTLCLAADIMLAHEAEILAANEKDLENGRERGLSESLLDRLALNHERLEGMADGLRQVAKLDDPVGEVLSMKNLKNGLIIGKKRVPIGVIGIIYEARPNVTSDAFGLCFKSGNCVILKGGSDAICSNIAIVAALQEALTKMQIPAGTLSLIESTDRETTGAFMKMKDYVDLLIPRGGAGLIQNVVNNATIPVIETGVGNCHVYVDEYADLDMAVDIITNAKTQRVSVCNACESVVVHRAVATEFMPMLYDALKEYDVQMRCDSYALSCLDGDLPLAVEAVDEDWGKEYLDYIISVKTVDSLDEAIAHINKYNTSHSETIVTRDYDICQKFLDEVDSACVYVNASTRFSDGNEFGFGAEVGISTQKLHARGPMGLEALTSYKYTIYGNGQIRK